MVTLEKHKRFLDDAILALHKRTYYAAFPEQPSPAVYGETADQNGQEKFKNQLGKKFDGLLQQGEASWIGQEESPYLQEPLGITYPSFEVPVLIENADKAFHTWRRASADQRAVVLMDSLEQVKARFFEIAYATMHTTGQGFMMAFQASGPHAADRALEALAMGYEELQRFPGKVLWDKPMGKFNITLQKEWRAIPKGISLVIGCATFPTWNSVPGIYASLITGNPVIVKPHPGAILPIAIFVAELQKSLQKNGFDGNTCQLAVDTFDHMITKELAEHPQVKLIDYTGNSAFGNYLERLPNKVVFTEKTGVNSVILESTEDIDKVAANIAFAASLYSGQMCTAPQNIFIPASGIHTPQGNISFEAFAEKLVGQITGLADNPKAGPVVLGAIQNRKTCDRIDEAKRIATKVWLDSRKIINPQFANARIATPLVIELSSAQKDLFSAELFGPIMLLIRTSGVDESISLAKELAQHHGAISCGAYTTDLSVRERIADEMALAATPVSFNLTGNIYMNQHAAFSDFHVTGGNPAGNASFTNPDYVNRRFTWVGHREPAVVA